MRKLIEHIKGYFRNKIYKGSGWKTLITEGHLGYHKGEITQAELKEYLIDIFTRIDNREQSSSFRSSKRIKTKS